MRFSYTTRLDSSMSTTTLNATVLASMAELCAAVDAGSLPDHVNLHPMARIYSGQLGTIDGDRLALAADGFGVPTEAIKPGAVTATPMASTSVSDRAVEYTRGSRGVRGLICTPKLGLLRGIVTINVADTAATGTKTVDWTADAAPTVSELLPAGWTAPRTLMRIAFCPLLNGSYLWVRTGPLRIAMGWITATSSTGFTIKIHDYQWDSGTHTSSDYTTGSRDFKAYWFALMEYA